MAKFMHGIPFARSSFNGFVTVFRNEEDRYCGTNTCTAY
jgi:hypothetical protein